VYISKISLKNIRGFESLEFDLDRGEGSYAGWSVFTGSNGAGKTTLLKAIAACLIPLEARLVLSNDDYFMRKDRSSGEINLRFSRTEGDDWIPGISPFPDGEYGQGVAFHFPHGGFQGGIFTGGVLLQGWFSCGYGPFRRITSTTPRVEQIQQTRDSERFATLFLEAATLSEVDTWLGRLKFEALEESQDAAEQLRGFLNLVGESLLPHNFSIDRVDSKGLWLKDPNGVELSWFEMSDGHRSAVLLVADIIRHMTKTYGIQGLYGRDEAGRIFVQRSGVVLIDEIDAHLHPEWQREIGFWLKSHFPKVQFLVTTHSPIILQAADPNGLFVLPEPGSGDEPRRLTHEEYQKIVVSRPNLILLSPAFGLENDRSEVVVEKRQKYSKLQGKKRAGAMLSAEEDMDLQELSKYVGVDEGD
jgi:energy-coupling factor transporter ATP-binding protein EcfA2